MAHIVKQNRPIEKKLIPKAEALELFAEKGQTLKCQLIEEKAGEQVQCYTMGEFIDFCLGPHLPSTKEIKAFKLKPQPSQSYWKGREGNPEMQRIYGYAFFTKEELDQHLHRLEEAKRRDHRKLGRELDLFSIAGRDGRRPHPLAPEGRLHPQADRGLLARPAPRGRLRPRLQPAHRQAGPVEDVRSHRVLQREHVLADRDRERPVPAEADELPVPHHDLQARSCAATASCRCASPSSAPSTGSSARACCTASCACAASPRTTRTSSAARTSSTPRSCACWTSSPPCWRRSASPSTRRTSRRGRRTRRARTSSGRSRRRRSSARSRSAASRTRSIRARASSTGRRSTSRSRTRWTAPGSARPSRWTSTTRTASSWSTSARTARRTSRSCCTARCSAASSGSSAC